MQKLQIIAFFNYEEERCQDSPGFHMIPIPSCKIAFRTSDSILRIYREAYFAKCIISGSGVSNHLT